MPIRLGLYGALLRLRQWHPGHRLVVVAPAPDAQLAPVSAPALSDPDSTTLAVVAAAHGATVIPSTAGADAQLVRKVDRQPRPMYVAR